MDEEVVTNEGAEDVKQPEATEPVQDNAGAVSGPTESVDPQQSETQETETQPDPVAPVEGKGLLGTIKGMIDTVMGKPDEAATTETTTDQDEAPVEDTGAEITPPAEEAAPIVQDFDPKAEVRAKIESAIRGTYKLDEFDLKDILDVL